MGEPGAGPENGHLPVPSPVDVAGRVERAAQERATGRGRSRQVRRPRPGRDTARSGAGEDGESLRGLSGGGPSQVGVDGAMRARDVSRPRPGPGQGSGGNSPVAS